MNKTKRFLYGVFSSLLLAVGFARAADGFDPITQGVDSTTDRAITSRASDPCTSPCDIDIPV
jgi:hypothetical protein